MTTCLRCTYPDVLLSQETIEANPGLSVAELSALGTVLRCQEHAA